MSLGHVLARVCALQPKYSSANTPEMQERGLLVRGALADEIRKLLPKLQSAFSSVFNDLAVEASDGIGRKTEAPWVRLFSSAMSPNPREGFYIVIHFAADGSAAYITVGCGSTIWGGGDLRQIPDEELHSRTEWARSIITQRWGTSEPFSDVIRLGAKASLPRTFEKATVIARRVAVSEFELTDLDNLLYQAAERLNEVYLAQRAGRDVSPGEQDAENIVSMVKPLRRGRSQGRGLSPVERRAVELRAMEIAIDKLTQEGYTCKDTSAVESYDLLASKVGSSFKVEVKGTTSDLCESVLMTKNEVDLHRREKGATGLIIVSKIRLIKNGKSVDAVGGEAEILLGWDVDQWSSVAIAFQIKRVLDLAV